MRVEKTGQVVKVDINYIPNLHKFINLMTWNIEDFINLAGERINPGFPMKLQVAIDPDFLLLPVYKYSPIPNGLVLSRLGVESERENKIRIENLGIFDIYKVIEDDNGVNIIVEVELYLSSEIVKPRMVEVVFTLEPNSDYTKQLEFGYKSSIDTSFKWDNYFRTLRWARGRKYSRFLWLNSNSNVFRNLYAIEKNAFALINFLYTLYTFKDKASFEYNLLRPHTELLRSYGNTFEEVLSVINEVMLLAS